MANDRTKLHSEMYGRNIKTVTHRIGTDEASFTRCVARPSKKFTILGASFLPDETGTSPVGSLTVSAGATNAAKQSTDAYTLAAFTVGTPVLFTHTSTNEARAAGDCIYLALVDTSGTQAAGTVSIDYVLTDAES